MKNSHPEMWDELTNEKIMDCIEAYSIISSILKYVYTQEKELLNYADKLIIELKKYIFNKENAANLLAARKDFFIAYSIYDAADWSFIKQQASGINKDSEDFDSIYSKKLKSFEKEEL